MVKIYSAPVGANVHNLANVLEGHGIACQIRGEERRSVIGELPPHECWPELWVQEDQAAEARKIIAAANVSDQPGWTCSNCGEELEGQFDVCWQCGTERAQ